MLFGWISWSSFLLHATAGAPDAAQPHLAAALAAKGKSEVEPLLAAKQLVGLVIGAARGEEVAWAGFGTPELGTGAPVDERTMFEIGSVTKVFTAILLAEMAAQGEVALSDPIEKFMPAGVAAPTRAGRSITLLDLALHRSSLPRIPPRTILAALVSDDPYANFSAERLYDFVGGYSPSRDIGSEYEYSNLGYGLLGQLLARRADTDYGSLLDKRVLRPLGLENTTISLPGDQAARVAKPYLSGGKPAHNWNLAAMAPAGALWSSARDMLRFIQANLAPPETDLYKAMAECRAARAPTGIDGLSMGLGWHILERKGAQALAKEGREPIIWHNGGTGGYRSFVGLIPARRVGVVVLANTTHEVDAIALSLLESLAAPAADR